MDRMTSSTYNEKSVPSGLPRRSEAASGRPFATTRWTIVLAAGRADTTQAQVALEKRCPTYWDPLYACARRQGHAPEDAQDLTQEFFAKLIAKHYPGDVDQLKVTLTGERGTIPYAEIGAQLGMSEGAVKVAVHRLRRHYREALRAEIAETVARPGEVEEELRHLFVMLSGLRAEGDAEHDGHAVPGPMWP